MTFKKILVPVDFSDCSASALSYAMQLNEKLGGDVDVLYAYEIPTFVPPHLMVMMGDIDAPLSDHIEREATVQLAAFLKKRGLDSKPNVSARTLLGPPALTILEAVGEDGYDLVVMGTHGRTGLSRMVMGSTAEKVVRGSPVPVLTVREPASEEKSEGKH
jgi:universal stress protein A